MPQNTNQNQNPKNEKGNNSRIPENKSTPQKQDNRAQTPPPTIRKGALNNALMRTFQGDAVKKGIQSVSRNNPTSKQAPQSDTTVTPEKKKNAAVVHTFKDDVQGLVRNRKMSMTRVAALESDKGNPQSPQGTQREPWKTTVIVVLTILFLVIGGVLGVSTYYAYQLNTAPNLTPQFAPAIVFTEARESINVTDKNARNIMTTLANARRNIFSSLGSVVELHLTELVPIEEEQKVPVHLDSIDFLQAIEADLPKTFLQTLGLEYLVGIHVIDESVPFLILTTQSYGHAFAGMLEWEANIEENLTPFFSPNAEFIKPAVAENQNSFSDAVVENIDVRILRDSNNTIRIMYAFVDRSTVVVTTNIRTLVELASRLRVQQ